MGIHLSEYDRGSGEGGEGCGGEGGEGGYGGEGWLRPADVFRDTIARLGHWWFSEDGAIRGIRPLTYCPTLVADSWEPERAGLHSDRLFAVSLDYFFPYGSPTLP